MVQPEGKLNSVSKSAAFGPFYCENKLVIKLCNNYYKRSKAELTESVVFLKCITHYSAKSGKAGTKLVWNVLINAN